MSASAAYAYSNKSVAAARSEIVRELAITPPLWASAAQAKSMPYFAGIDWERAALFPRDQPRPELAQIAAAVPAPSAADHLPPPVALHASAAWPGL